MSGKPGPVKDGEASHPVAAEWRPVLCAVVRAFVRGDFELAEGVEGVEPVSGETATQMREYLAHYGATLVELPEETWETSCAQWYGHKWEVLVDLWTREEGRSDVVLQVDVVESDGAYRFALHLLYVP